MQIPIHSNSSSVVDPSWCSWIAAAMICTDMIFWGCAERVHQEIEDTLLSHYITLPFLPCISTCITLIYTQIRSVTSWESLYWLLFSISLVFVWSIQPGCLSLSHKVINTHTDVYDQILNCYLMWSNVPIIIANEIFAQIFFYDTPDQTSSNDYYYWLSGQLSNDNVVDQSFLCWCTLHDRSVLSFRYSWPWPPLVVIDRWHWPALQCWPVFIMQDHQHTYRCHRIIYSIPV